MAAAAPIPSDAPHVPVLLDPILQRCAPISGTWLDGTLGAGGYTKALLEAGAETVIGVDQDPLAIDMAAEWSGRYEGRLRLKAGNFEDLDQLVGVALDGVVLDLGVSSMQLDQADRGFSFLRDGPLDMRMSQSGPSAADLVAEAEEGLLADLLFHLGEERAARRIARAIVAARNKAPITRTSELAEIVADCLPRAKPGQSHPATRSFQALRIAINDELGALVRGLEAAERALASGGWLAVVTFHSIEDRIVKRFLMQASGGGGRANRYAPETQETKARFTLVPRKAIAPNEAELEANPRARSARLRIARRTEAPAAPADRAALGLPHLYSLTETK